ncbi:MAG: hypothetical protein Q9203_005901 [Teloschistes exilis]
MPINWKNPKAFERLIAAVIAAHDLKLDYRRIATMYGQGATYDAVEGRFRVFRKEAAKLQQEISNGDRPTAPRRGTSSTSAPTTAASSFADSSFAGSETSTPKKGKTSTPRANKKGNGNGNGKVLTGRVVKNANLVKKEKEKGGKGVKTEEEEDDEEMDAVGVAEGFEGLDEVFGLGALEV